MVRGLLISLAILIVLVVGWLIAIAAGIVYYNNRLDLPWIAGLGPARDAPKRYPSFETNEPAETLKALAVPLGIPIEQNDPPRQTDEFAVIHKTLSDYVRQQVERPDDQILPPPRDVGEFLTAHEADLAALRAHVVTSAEPIRWKQDVGPYSASAPPLGHVKLGNLLVAHALEAARLRRYGTAWDDLRVTWELQRTLWPRPEMLSFLIALSHARTINAVARKLPTPPPSWFDEMQRFDYEQSFREAFQIEAWRTSHLFGAAVRWNADKEKARAEGPVVRPLLVVTTPYTLFQGGDHVASMRALAVELDKTGCRVEQERLQRFFRDTVGRWNRLSRGSPTFVDDWQRVQHFQVELEGTAKMLALKRQQDLPYLAESRCRDGSWTYARHPDGSTTLQFSQELPLEKDETRYPLHYRYP